MEAANKSFQGKDRHTGVKELAKEHTEVQQCSGEQWGAEPWVLLAARCPPGLSSVQHSVHVHDFAWDRKLNVSVSPGDCNIDVCCRVKQAENYGVRIFWVLKWFVSICPRFWWHPGCLQRNMKKSSPWSHTVVVMLLQAFENPIFMSFSRSPHLFTIFSFVGNMFAVKYSMETIH